MPYSTNNSLKIFVSYASEDGKIAEALAKALRATFVNSLEITMMSEFPMGINWRRLIDTSIGQTDVLIAIATGRLKPSHSFTGSEIGSFSFSMGANPKMARFNHLDRRMIPFAVLEKSPSTMNEFEGIDIDPAVLRDVRFDPKNLAGEFKVGGRSRTDGPEIQIVKLLADLENLFNQTKLVNTGADIIIQQERFETLEKNAHALYLDVLSLMLAREMSVDHPKTKIIIRTQPSLYTGGKFDSLETSIIKIEGKGHDVFGLPEPYGEFFKWSELISRADEDIAFQWRKALLSLISSSKTSEFIDDNSIVSFDRKKLYRIFASSVTEYYSNETEFEVYVVEILRRKDYGDPDTTLLLKALDVSLSYRFMFLEETSEFSPIVFKATKLSELQVRASDMIDQLNLLLLTADQYELGDAKNIIRILGIPASSEIDERFKQWDTQKNILYQATKDLLKIKDMGYSEKSGYIVKLTAFCEHTRQMNESYTAAVLDGLHKQFGVHS